MEAARRDLIVDEEARQLRSIELAACESSSRIVEAKSTTDGAVIVERGTIDSEETTEGI